MVTLIRIIGQFADKVATAIANAFTKSEFEQCHIIQDQLYLSDFDRLVASTET